MKHHCINERRSELDMALVAACMSNPTPTMARKLAQQAKHLFADLIDLDIYAREQAVEIRRLREGDDE